MPPRFPPKYTTNPNRVTLDLDPITSDALNQAAKAAGRDRQRLAYELVQRGLRIATTMPATSAPAIDSTEPDYSAAVQRGIDAARSPRT